MTDIKKKSESKPIWIHCRANENCEGNLAYLVYSKAAQAVQSNGGLDLHQGGFTNRYECTTCRGSFTIVT